MAPFDRSAIMGAKDIPKSGMLPVKTGDVEILPGAPANRTRIIAVNPDGRQSVTLWANIPAAWAGAVMTVHVTIGILRVPIATVVLAAFPAGPNVLANLVNSVGGASAVEVDITGIPPLVPAVPVPPLQVVLSSWNA